MNLWDLHQKYIQDLNPILDDMNSHGVRIDLEEQNALRAIVDSEMEKLTDQVTSTIPTHLCPVKLWKKQPKDRILEEVLIPGKFKVCSICGEQIKSKSVHLKGGKKNPCVGAEIIKKEGMVLAWHQRLPFNALSNKQLIGYCRHFKHPLGKSATTFRDTVNAKHLLKLEAKHGKAHPIYALVRTIRGLNKVYSYMFTPDENGYAHGMFKHTPWTLRLAQADYNFMNISKRGQALYAAEIRRTIVPSPGHVFVAADSSSIEAVILARLSGDDELLDIARKGIHAYTACRQLGWEFTPENTARVKSEHKNLYNRKKTITYLSLFGGKPKMIHEQFPDDFPTVESAEREQMQFFECCPSIPRYWDQIRRVAQKQAYLESHWGFRVPFYNVLTRDGSQVKLGEDANDAVAFGPQHGAGMFGRESLLMFGASWLRPHMPSNGFCHDGYVFDVPEEREQEAVELVGEILTREIPELGGLRIGCEIEVGRNWGGLCSGRIR